MPNPAFRAARAPLTRAINSLAQSAYSLHHELRLVADVASAGTHAGTSVLSLETLGTALSAYADRIEKLHAELEALEGELLSAPATSGDDDAEVA